jgi:hypothetical protein
MMPGIETGMTDDLLRPDFFRQVEQTAEPRPGDFSYPGINASGTQVPERPMDGESASFFTHSPNGGADDAGLSAFQSVGAEPDLDIHSVFENQVYIPAHMVPRHIDKHMPKHGAHPRADIMSFQGFRFLFS